MRKLYLELQTELDKLDCMRKNWTYFAMKREEFLKVIAIKQPDEKKRCGHGRILTANGGTLECD